MIRYRTSKTTINDAPWQYQIGEQYRSSKSVLLSTLVIGGIIGSVATDCQLNAMPAPKPVASQFTETTEEVTLQPINFTPAEIDHGILVALGGMAGALVLWNVTCNFLMSQHHKMAEWRETHLLATRKRPRNKPMHKRRNYNRASSLSI